MHASVESDPPITADIEAALDGLLVAVIADEARPRRRREAVIGEPIGRACREQIKALGQLIFDLTGSTAGMRNVLERVAERDRTKVLRRTGILDHCWSGTGQEGKDLWFA